MPSREKLHEFVGWTQKHITGDEKGQAQIFLDRLFQAFGQAASLDVGGHPEFRIRKADDNGGGHGVRRLRLETRRSHRNPVDGFDAGGSLKTTQSGPAHQLLSLRLP